MWPHVLTHSAWCRRNVVVPNGFFGVWSPQETRDGAQQEDQQQPTTPEANPNTTTTTPKSSKKRKQQVNQENTPAAAAVAAANGQQQQQPESSSKGRSRPPPDLIQLSGFWVPLSESCFSSSSHDLKHLGLQLFQVLLPWLTPQAVPVVLQQSLLHCLAQCLRHKDAYLHASAKRSVVSAWDGGREGWGKGVWEGEG